jgi:hypothetical protein
VAGFGRLPRLVLPNIGSTAAVVATPHHGHGGEPVLLSWREV